MAYKHIITLDFETYFSQTYSLRAKSLNTSEYVRHPEYKTQCVGIKVDDEPAVWVAADNVSRALNMLDWDNSALLAHHTQFDGFILAHHYQITPAYYLDTLSMGRALHSVGVGGSLNALANLYKLGNKIPDVLGKTKGVVDLPDDLMRDLGTYCAMDVELCRMLFDKMIDKFPQSELDLIDMTVRMFCEPKLLVDIPRVKKELDNERNHKQQLIQRANARLDQLTSADKFADLLTTCGVKPPTKISPRTGKVAWAFSKADLEFQSLQEHPDERVRNLIAARLAAKSTIGETRAQRFLDAGQDGKRLPVYLKYYGAHTGRWSAGNNMNLQNLKRGGELRKSIIAPEGSSVVVADSSQIEARTLAWLAGDKRLLGLFETGQDVYKHMASAIYGVEVEDVTSDQRFVGKVAVLGLGYGMGWKKFQNTLELGLMGKKVEMTTKECAYVVNAYREERAAIPALWNTAQSWLEKMYHNQDDTYGCLKVIGEANQIVLPNGMYIEYPGLSCDYDPDSHQMRDFISFDYENAAKIRLGLAPDYKKSKRLYGGIVTENVVQALARIIVAEQMLRVAKSYTVVTMTHDEIVCLAPTEEADAALDFMIDTMRQPPAWCSDLPLNAEGGHDYNYSK